MKRGFRFAIKIYLYSVILFTIIYWIYILNDDYIFIKKYWETNDYEYLGLWLSWFIVYFLAFTFYFWLIATAIILIYNKIIKRNNK